jgi:putative Holliday junction resolvase
MSIDFGLKQIGIAVSDPLGITAQGVCVIQNTNNKEITAAISKLIEKYGVTEIIMGNPIRFNMDPGTLDEKIKAFAKRLTKKTGLNVLLVDERLTTLQAEKMLVAADVRRDKRREVVDKVAAQMLLQSYLDSLPSQNKIA